MARQLLDQLLRGTVALLAKTPLTPNALTWVGLLLNLGAALAILGGLLPLGGVLILMGGLFDLLDGALARATGRATPFGALLDSTLDRLGDAVLLLALLPQALARADLTQTYLIFAALVGSFLVSYVRARAEGLGLECRGGLLTRAWRLGLLAAGLILGWVELALWLLAGLSFFTVGQRWWLLWRTLSKGS